MLLVHNLKNIYEILKKILEFSINDWDFSLSFVKALVGPTSVLYKGIIYPLLLGFSS